MPTAKPDGVIIASPTKLHIMHSKLCVEAGIPVLIEKPISDDLAAARQLTQDGKVNVPLLVDITVGSTQLSNALMTSSNPVRLATYERSIQLVGSINQTITLIMRLGVRKRARVRCPSI